MYRYAVKRGWPFASPSCAFCLRIFLVFLAAAPTDPAHKTDPGHKHGDDDDTGCIKLHGSLHNWRCPAEVQVEWMTSAPCRMPVQRTSSGWRPDHPEDLRAPGSTADPKNRPHRNASAADGGPTIPKTPSELSPRTHICVCINDRQACPECQAAQSALAGVLPATHDIFMEVWWDSGSPMTIPQICGVKPGEPVHNRSVFPEYSFFP